MAFPLTMLLKSAPGLISAAADIIGVIRRNKESTKSPEMVRVEALSSLLEQQAKVIEELAVNNRYLVLAVRNNRIVAVVSLGVAILALGRVFWSG